jgi:cob(I)alamin adenosyltransferase
MEELKLQVLEPKQKVGLIVVITGHGKGKTTSALGIALRAAGHNMKVCIIEFMKGDMYSGEIDSIKRLSRNIELHLTGKGFCGIMGNRIRLRTRANAQMRLDFQRRRCFRKL